MTKILFENEDVILIESENSFVLKSKKNEIKCIFDGECNIKHIVIKKK